MTSEHSGTVTSVMRYIPSGQKAAAIHDPAVCRCEGRRLAGREGETRRGSRAGRRLGGVRWSPLERKWVKPSRPTTRRVAGCM